MFWIATVQGMDYEACCHCETAFMVTAETKEIAAVEMDVLAKRAEAIVVPNTLQGPYSVDEALKVLQHHRGRYLKPEEVIAQG